MRLGWLVCLLLTVPTAWSQSDDIFNNPDGDIIAPEGQKVDLSPILANPIPVFSGNITMSSVAYAAWNDAISVGVGYDLKSGLSLDYRPDPTIHWSGSITSSIPAGAFSWKTPSIGSMYLDYTLADTVFFTLGKFSMGWGVGRLFEINDLVAHVDSGLAVKAFVPIGPVNLTGVVLAQSAFFPVITTPAVDEFGVAAQAETSLGPINLGVSGYRQKESPRKVDVYMKTVLWGVDIFSEVKFTRPKIGTWSDWTSVALAGLYWEGFEPKLKLQAEWTGNITNFEPTDDQTLAIATSLVTVPGTGLHPSIKWTHTFFDNSGQIAFGIEADPFKHIHLTLGLPFSYGAKDSRWVKNTVTAYHGLSAAGLKVDLSTSF